MAFDLNAEMAAAEARQTQASVDEAQRQADAAATVISEGLADFRVLLHEVFSQTLIYNLGHTWMIDPRAESWYEASDRLMVGFEAEGLNFTLSRYRNGRRPGFWQLELRDRKTNGGRFPDLPVKGDDGLLIGLRQLIDLVEQDREAAINATSRGTLLNEFMEEPALPSEDFLGMTRYQWAVFHIALHQEGFDPGGLERSKAKALAYCEAMI